MVFEKRDYSIHNTDKLHPISCSLMEKTILSWGKFSTSRLLLNWWFSISSSLRSPNQSADLKFACLCNHMSPFLKILLPLSLSFLCPKPSGCVLIYIICIHAVTNIYILLVPFLLKTLADKYINSYVFVQKQIYFKSSQYKLMQNWQFIQNKSLHIG